MEAANSTYTLVRHQVLKTVISSINDARLRQWNAMTNMIKEYKIFVLEQLVVASNSRKCLAFYGT